MKEKLTNNLGLKILAVFLAFFIWLIVVNVSNPVVSRSQDVPVEILNEEILTKSKRTYEIVSKNTVTVSYDIRIRDAYKVSSSDFKVYADLSELYDVTGSIPLKVEVVNKNLKSLIDGTPSAKPGVIQIKTEELQRKRFTLQIRIDGQPEDGYALGSSTIDPEYIYVSGPISLIGQINAVGIEIDAENANDDLEDIAKPVLYDANGNRLTLGERVSMNKTEITYKTSILKVKNLTIDFETQGQVAEGYRFTGAVSSIQTIPVVGRTSALASLNTIKIPADQLDLAGATANKNVEIDLADYLPDHVMALEGIDTTAIITLKVESLKNKVIPVKLEKVTRIGELEEWRYLFEPGTIDVIVRGLEDDLKQMTIDDLRLTIDVSNMATGEYKGTLSYDVGDGFEVISYEAFNVKAAHKDLEEESTDKDEEATTTVVHDESAASLETEETSHSVSKTEETTE